MTPSSFMRAHVPLDLFGHIRPGHALVLAAMRIKLPMFSEAISGPASRQSMRCSWVRFGPPPVLSSMISGQTARMRRVDVLEDVDVGRILALGSRA